jgi:hypothetical protein
MSRVAGSRTLLLVALVALIVGTALVGRRLAVQSRSELSCIVEDSRTGGGSGLRDWADRLGYSTHALRAPLHEAGTELPSAGNMLISAGNDSWSPFGGESSYDDWSGVEAWIRAGNTLIVINSEPKTLPAPITRHFTSDLSRMTADGTVTPTIEPAPRSRNPLANETMALVPTWWGGELSVDQQGPRLQNLPSEFHLAGTGASTVLAGRRLGQGMVYLLLDESAWTNKGFDQADNAATLARILEQQLGRGGVLAFDEYRHGYGRVESFTTLFLSLPGARAFAGMAMAWGLFCLWGTTRRLSPPDEYREVERRTALEYIESVATMNQRARAAPLVVDAVRLRVRYLLRKRGIVNPSANAVLDQAARLAQAGERPATPKRDIEMVSEILSLKKEFYGTRRDTRTV